MSELVGVVSTIPLSDERRMELTAALPPDTGWAGTEHVALGAWSRPNHPTPTLLINDGVGVVAWTGHANADLADEAALSARRLRQHLTDTSGPVGLLGAWAAVVWTEHVRTLTLATDHLGYEALYWSRDDTEIAFATSPWLLRDIHDRHESDLKNLDRLLSSWTHDVGSTWFANIHRVPPGHRMAVTEGRVVTTPYWHPQPRSLTSTHDVSAWVEALRALLDDIITEYTRFGTISVAVSGGLDSSVVAAAMARVQGRPVGFTSPVTDAMVNPDAPYVELTRRVVDVREVRTDGMGPFDALTTPTWQDGPDLTSRVYGHVALAEASVRAGHPVLLTGAGGEYTLSPPPTAARRGAFLRGDLPYSAVVGRARRAWLRTRFGARPDGRQTLRSVFQADVLNDLTESPATVPRGIDGLLALSTLAPMGRHLRPVGCLLLHPLGDVRLLEATMHLPAEILRWRGLPRGAIRHVLDGSVPPEIVRRTSKGPFSPDYPRRFNEQRRAALDYVSSLGPRHPGAEIIDVGQVQRILRDDMREDDPTAVTRRSAEQLLAAPFAVSLLLFMERLHDPKLRFRTHLLTS